MKNKEHLQEEPLALKSMLLVALGLVAVITVIVLGFSWVNDQRRQRVIAEYDQSVAAFVQQNGDNLVNLFTQVMDSCQTIFTANSQAPNHSLQSIDCPEARSALDALDKTALKDSSSTAYIRVQEGNTQLLEASGSFHGKQGFSDYRFNMNSDIQQYLLNGEEINRWQDFLYFLPRKEVIVPVEYNDQKLGYMLLSVIEK